MQTETKVARHRTAISRPFLSRPLLQALDDGLLSPETSLFDYGCGRGNDLRHLRRLGIQASGWDPAFAPDEERRPADIVNLGYVVNVIEDPREREDALRQAWALAQSALVVSARLQWEADTLTGRPHGDGIITSTGTFQRFYTQEELRGWIEHSLSVRPVAAAPGVFYVFRSPQARQRVLARASRGSRPFGRRAIAELIYEQSRQLLEPLERWVDSHRSLPTPADLGDSQALIDEFGSLRSALALVLRASNPDRWPDLDLGVPRRSERRFEQHLDLLQPLMDFLAERGRLPREAELSNLDGVAGEFGSIRAAFSLIRRVTGPERWTSFETAARADFLVYLALAALEGRPKFTDLPEDLQHDAKDFFGSYRAASQAADELLFATGNLEKVNQACEASPIGKITPDALYVHVSAIDRLPALLRVYEGCGRALSGRVNNAALVKLARDKKQVSYLIYPDFDRDPHPALQASVVARLGALQVQYRGFAHLANPPILHRKELLVTPEYPGWRKFSALSTQEEAGGLLGRPDIGTRDGWARALQDARLVLRGHRLTRAKA